LRSQKLCCDDVDPYAYLCRTRSRKAFHSIHICIPSHRPRFYASHDHDTCLAKDGKDMNPIDRKDPYVGKGYIPHKKLRYTSLEQYASISKAIDDIVGISVITVTTTLLCTLLIAVHHSHIVY